jgi:hypothetical protein
MAVNKVAHKNQLEITVHDASAGAIDPLSQDNNRVGINRIPRWH